MDQEQRAMVAQGQDPAIAGKIIRNIAEVERQWHLASGLLSERFMREVRQLAGKLAPENWKVIESGWSVILVPLEWKMSMGVGNGDAWLEIVEICNAEEEYSWIAAAAGVGSTQMGFELQFRNGLSPFGQVAIANDKAVDALLKLGFVRDERGERLYIPIKTQAEALAKGFEENDLEKALIPIRRAIELAISAKVELDKLVEQVRSAAKRK